jgi:hypothetical protein
MQRKISTAIIDLVFLWRGNWSGLANPNSNCYTIVVEILPYIAFSYLYYKKVMLVDHSHSILNPTVWTTENGTV